MESRPIYFLEDKHAERKREFKLYDEKDLNRLMPKGLRFPENREDVSIKIVDLNLYRRNAITQQMRKILEDLEHS